MQQKEKIEQWQLTERIVEQTDLHYGERSCPELKVPEMVEMKEERILPTRLMLRNRSGRRRGKPKQRAAFFSNITTRTGRGESVGAADNCRAGEREGESEELKVGKLGDCE